MKNIENCLVSRPRTVKEFYGSDQVDDFDNVQTSGTIVGSYEKVV